VLSVLYTHSFLTHIFPQFAAASNIEIVPCDISVAGRVLAAFPEHLSEPVPDNLAYLGGLAKQPDCAIIKLPNISAPVNQLQDCIAELRAKGYNVPLYPVDPSTPEEFTIQERYQALAGSAVNPVLREGNSDRRVAAPVKTYAQQNPHRMGFWSKASRTHVASMAKGDFFESEQSVIVEKETSVRIELEQMDGTTVILKPEVALTVGEVIDAASLNIQALQEFYETEMQDAADTDLLLSLHLKATMMKVSDPILFGHAIRVFFKDAFSKHEATLERVGANVPHSGLASMWERLEAAVAAGDLTQSEADTIHQDFEACYESRPWLAMVNSDKGITNLHAPNDVIIDASMPVVVRDAGQMWNRLGELEDTKCLIPDRCYATTYQEVINYVKTNGQFDVSTMGNVSNVGLMAKKAEEYGSHDKTFELSASGTVKVIDNTSDQVYMEHTVHKGDLYRMCQTKNVAIRDWVQLAVSRARATGSPTIFWLDERRGHDASLIGLVHEYLKEHDTSGLDITIQRPVDAVRKSMERATEGLDTISVTGNVLRDYLTDLFPILELGTSAKMLSIVPLLAGGGLYETGAGGSAPKHVQQFVQEGHLRWDSLGEYLAVAVALERIEDPKAQMLGECLNEAVGRILTNRKSPSRVVNQIDNRATNYYVALYWADALQQRNPTYAPIFQALSDNRAQIVQEFKECQGKPVDLGGYYLFDAKKTTAAMNPSPTLNKVLAEMMSK